MKFAVILMKMRQKTTFTLSSLIFKNTFLGFGMTRIKETNRIPDMISGLFVIAGICLHTVQTTGLSGPISGLSLIRAT